MRLLLLCVTPMLIHHRILSIPACSDPAVLSQLRSTGNRLLLLGHRGRSEMVVVPPSVADVVVVLESLPDQVCQQCALQ